MASRWRSRPAGRRASCAAPESAPYLHVASFALTADLGQFGAGVTATMGPDGVFAALVEYVVDRHAQPGAGLFASRRWQPRLRMGEFGHDRLQVMRPGHLGAQRFFTTEGRPFCLYAVVAPARRRPGSADRRAERGAGHGPL